MVRVPSTQWTHQLCDLKQTCLPSPTFCKRVILVALIVLKTDTRVHMAGNNCQLMVILEVFPPIILSLQCSATQPGAGFGPQGNIG